MFKRLRQTVRTPVGCVAALIGTGALLAMGCAVVALIYLGGHMVLEEWRAPSYVRAYRMSPDSETTIGDAVRYYSHPSFGFHIGSWDARDREDGKILVWVTVGTGATQSRAAWTYDPESGIVQPTDALAQMLSTKPETGH
jgi:hypothetical protein